MFLGFHSFYGGAVGNCHVFNNPQRVVMIQKLYFVFFWLGVFVVSFFLMVRSAQAVAGYQAPAGFPNCYASFSEIPLNTPFILGSYQYRYTACTAASCSVQVFNQPSSPNVWSNNWPSTWGVSSCAMAVCPAVGTLHSSGFFNVGTVPTGQLLKTACLNGCSINLVNGVVPAAKNLVNGVTHYFGQARYEHTSLNCTPDTPTFLADFVGTLPGATCGAGQQIITMNGVTKCFDSAGAAVNSNSASAVAVTKTLNDAAAAQAASDAAAAAAAALLAQNPAATPVEIAAAKQTAAAQAAAVSASQAIADPNAAFCKTNPANAICQTGAQAKAAGALPANSNGSWYTKTYPNGIQGVLTANFNTMKATPLFGLINNIVPTISGTSSTGCFTFNVWKVGNQQLCIPQGVLTFVGICMMLTALFSARSIIFGG